MIRLYVQEPLAVDGRVPATPDQAHYLLRVMRLTVASPLLLFNGRSGFSVAPRDHQSPSDGDTLIIKPQFGPVQ